ncbi:hypothetical protein CR513_42205, partial [Mucuna pruriens]
MKNILKSLRRNKELSLVFRDEEDLVVKIISTKQEIVANSTIEAKYIVATNAIKEVVWIRKFII